MKRSHFRPGLILATLVLVGGLVADGARAAIAPNATGGCDGATLDLASPNGTQYSAPDAVQDRGVFVSVIKNFNLCSIGIEGEFIPGETLTANIYAASGVARGPLLATGTVTVEFVGQRTHFIPISYSLRECTEYDIAVEWNHTLGWPWWDENTNTRPYDVGGVIRVRDGEDSGDAGNYALAHFTLQGSSSAAENQSNVAGTHGCVDAFGNQHGAFITAKKTHSVCALGLRVDFATAPSTLRAYVYEATGGVRGALVAEGKVAVPATGGTLITVPINAVLREGRQYDVGFAFGASAWRSCRVEAFPWQFNDLWTVDGLERFGVLDLLNNGVPAFQVSWSEGPGAAPLDITAPFLGAPAGVATTTIFAFGKYVNALNNEELTSLGWYADLGPGQMLVARVYNATGTTRGSLVSEGTITTGPAGMRWHDVPVAATLIAGQDYDLEIDWTGVSVVGGFPYWVFVGGQQPYNAYGILQVVTGEFGGVPDVDRECVQMRVNACATTVTGVKEGPSVTGRFTLSSAAPNPFSGSATLGFDLDEATTVSAAVYDVAGRKVADVLKSKPLPAGPGQLNLDAANLPPGVYFVKMTTLTKSLSRKITIVH